MNAINFFTGFVLDKNILVNSVNHVPKVIPFLEGKSGPSQIMFTIYKIKIIGVFIIGFLISLFIFYYLRYKKKSIENIAKNRTEINAVVTENIEEVLSLNVNIIPSHNSPIPRESLNLTPIRTNLPVESNSAPTTHRSSHHPEVLTPYKPTLPLPMNSPNPSFNIHNTTQSFNITPYSQHSLDSSIEEGDDLDSKNEFSFIPAKINITYDISAPNE